MNEMNFIVSNGAGMWVRAFDQIHVLNSMSVFEDLICWQERKIVSIITKINVFFLGYGFVNVNYERIFFFLF